MTLPERVTLYEVGPRDGLQNVGTPVPVAAKVAFVDALTAAGLGAIEVGAFVSPRAVPQMADSGAVFAAIDQRAGVRYPALVPNARGLDAALAAGVQEIAIFAAASETFNQKNINATIGVSIQRFAPVVAGALDAGVRVRGYVSTVWGCPYEGDVAPSAVLDVTLKLFDLGIDEVSLGDTIGVGVPTQVEEVLDLVLKRQAASSIALHFHDTRGTALANIMAALPYGITTFDASAGGLGGCPFAPGATGNVATEELVNLFEKMGVATGVDLDKLVEASLGIEVALGTRLPSRVLQARRGTNNAARH